MHAADVVDLRWRGGADVGRVIAGRIAHRHGAESSAGVTMPGAGHEFAGTWKGRHPLGRRPGMSWYRGRHATGPAVLGRSGLRPGPPCPAGAGFVREIARAGSCRRVRGSARCVFARRQPARLGPAPSRAEPHGRSHRHHRLPPGTPSAGEGREAPIIQQGCNPHQCTGFVVGTRARVPDRSPAMPGSTLAQRQPDGRRVRPPALSLAETVSDIVPADPPAFGRIVARHVVEVTLVIVTFQAVRPGWRTVTMGAVDEPLRRHRGDREGGSPRTWRRRSRSSPGTHRPARWRRPWTPGRRWWHGPRTGTCLGGPRTRRHACRSTPRTPRRPAVNGRSRRVRTTVPDASTTSSDTVAGDISRNDTTDFVASRSPSCGKKSDGVRETLASAA